MKVTVRKRENGLFDVRIQRTRTEEGPSESGKALSKDELREFARRAVYRIAKEPMPPEPL